MKNKLGRQITFKNIMSFSLPSMALMFFMSSYSMVDGLFIARFVGEIALSSVNISWPIFCIIIAVGVMFGIGGSAICARNLGQKKEYLAKSKFTLLTISAFIIGVFIAIFGLIFIEDILYLLGANDEVYSNSYDYIVYILYFAPIFVLQAVFHHFLIAAAKPNLAFIMIFIGGAMNLILDYIFILEFGYGVKGAAIATSLGTLISLIFGLGCFIFSKEALLKFVRPSSDLRVIALACENGSSEMVNHLASAVIIYLFNMEMLHLIGNEGVAAVGIILYIQFLLASVLLGYSGGVSPIISYNYGERNVAKLHAIFKLSIKFILLFSLATFLFSFIFAKYITLTFTQNDSSLHVLATSGLKIFSICFMFCGINIFTSALFTAFSNGKISAILAFLRTIVFISASLVILPKFLGVYGVWLAVPIGEFLCAVISVYLLYRYKKVYKY